MMEPRVHPSRDGRCGVQAWVGGDVCPETPTEHLSRDPGPHQLPRWVWSSGEGLSWSSG